MLLHAKTCLRMHVVYEALFDTNLCDWHCMNSVVSDTKEYKKELYPTYDILQRYRQGNICRIHPAVRAIHNIYCIVVTTELHSGPFPILDSTYTKVLGIQTS